MPLWRVEGGGCGEGAVIGVIALLFVVYFSRMAVASTDRTYRHVVLSVVHIGVIIIIMTIAVGKSAMMLT